MTDQHADQPFYARKRYRLLTVAFGLLLIGVGVYALIFADTSIVVRLVGGSALVLAGYNMVSSACRAKESWLSKLGPLP
jgi:uncharacterized membrane protein HdeD (DUF308 family)